MANMVLPCVTAAESAAKLPPVLGGTVDTVWESTDGAQTIEIDVDDTPGEVRVTRWIQLPGGSRRWEPGDRARFRCVRVTSWRRSTGELEFFDGRERWWGPVRVNGEFELMEDPA